MKIGAALAALAAVFLFYKQQQLAKGGLAQEAKKHMRLALVAAVAAAGLGFYAYRRSVGRQSYVTLDDFDL